MAAGSKQAAEWIKTTAGVLAGIVTYKLIVTLPEWWNEALKHTVQVWWPVLLIAAGVFWWMLDHRSKLDRLQELCSRPEWEAKHGM